MSYQKTPNSSIRRKKLHNGHRPSMAVLSPDSCRKEIEDIFEEQKKVRMSESSGEEVYGLGLTLTEAWLHRDEELANGGGDVGPPTSPATGAVNHEYGKGELEGKANNYWKSQASSSKASQSVEGEGEGEEAYDSVSERSLKLKQWDSPDLVRGRRRESDSGSGTYNDSFYLHSKSPRTPLPPGTELDNFKLIDTLLEENYRGQAESFVRNAKSVSKATGTGPKTATATTTATATVVNSTAGTASIASALPALTRSVSGLSNSSTIDQVCSPSGFYTPTRINPRAHRNTNFAALQRSSSIAPLSATKRQFVLPDRKSYQTPRGRVVVETVGVQNSERSPQAHATYSNRIYTIPADSPTPLIPKRRPLKSQEIVRGPLYFTEDERRAIAELVALNLKPCEHGKNCIDCLDLEYAHHENKAMSTSLPPEERQKIINNNRSLRNIKNELESLAESGTISDDVYDSIMKSLPNEAPLNGSSARANPPAAPTNQFANMKVNDAPPPAYNAPPSLPSRNSKPELTRAIALYRYAEPGDCNFEVGDHISVTEYMNADWWLGKNVRTGQEGVFPVNYVQATASAPSPNGAYGNEKAGAYQQQQSGPPPPGPSNPYNSAVPPMQIAEQPSESKPGKGGEMGKKFGKKLGNAAIFGAGATIGGNIVNSIF